MPARTLLQPAASSTTRQVTLLKHRGRQLQLHIARISSKRSFAKPQERELSKSAQREASLESHTGATPHTAVRLKELPRSWPHCSFATTAKEQLEQKRASRAGEGQPASYQHGGVSPCTLVHRTELYVVGHHGVIGRGVVGGADGLEGDGAAVHTLCSTGKQQASPLAQLLAGYNAAKQQHRQLLGVSGATP